MISPRPRKETPTPHTPGGEEPTTSYSTGFRRRVAEDGPGPPWPRLTERFRKGSEWVRTACDNGSATHGTHFLHNTGAGISGDDE